MLLRKDYLFCVIILAEFTSIKNKNKKEVIIVLYKSEQLTSFRLTICFFPLC